MTSENNINEIPLILQLIKQRPSFILVKNMWDAYHTSPKIDYPILVDPINKKIIWFNRKRRRELLKAWKK